MSNLTTPILFLIFNRPDTTKKVFDSIRQIRPARFYVAADGPRSHKAGEKELCDQTRKIIENVDWPCKVITLFRDSNLGCKQAVSSAITWFFEHEEEGIILEDDCLPDPSFFHFSQTLLSKYRDNLDVMHIVGCVRNIIPESYMKDSYYFSKIPGIWGWATWRRAWNLYDIEMSGFKQFVDSGGLRKISSIERVRKHLFKIFDLAYNKKIDTWDYQWYYTLLKNNGIVAAPYRSLVTNIGFNENSFNSKDVTSELANIKRYPIENIKHPAEVKWNKAIDELYLGKSIKPSYQNFRIYTSLKKLFKSSLFSS